MNQITQHLFELQDTQYRDFQGKLIPTVKPDTIIGVRTPDLRKYAKELYKQSEAQAFLAELPHQWFDENQLHAFILSEEKDFDTCIAQVEAFLPYIEQKKLPAWTHNKTIQKAVESYRITDGQKTYLRTKKVTLK